MGRWISHFNIGWMSLCFISLSASAGSPQAVKDWTFLVFLNGNNNLDSYGALDINEMETVGSTDRVNVVVQWASMAKPTVKRLLVQKDSNPDAVTSPIVQDVGAVDMGKAQSLLDFVKWGVEKYPAKRYFINIWNHGSGCHLKRMDAVHSKDISWDDKTGHSITTEQLGVAMSDAAKLIGHKVDIYGSDACLMAMGEVAAEMMDSVDTFAGSQETEPGEGWAYDSFLERWNATANLTPAEVGAALAETYTKSYQGGSQGSQDVTFSVMRLDKLGAFMDSIRDLSREVASLPAADSAKFLDAAGEAQSFAYSDYVDVTDLADRVQKSGSKIDAKIYDRVRQSVQDLVVSNQVTEGYARAHGVSFWVPGYSGAYRGDIARYKGLRFHKATDWGTALDHLWK